MSVVTLYGRPQCHLCDEARQAILQVGDPELELVEVNIEEDEALHARFLERIPVIEVRGRIVSELGIDEPALRAALLSRT